jgi:hypothetical protein
MRFKLLAQHVIRDVLLEKGEIVEDPPAGASPLMEGLDDEARAAVTAAKLKVFGRYPWPYGFYPPGYMGTPPLDNPPIDRPLDDNQPVYHFVGTPEYTGSSGAGGPPS